MSASAAATGSHDRLEDLVEEVFNEYITNEMPVHLLHITEDGEKIRFQLVDRDFVRAPFKEKRVPDNIHADFAGKIFVNGEEGGSHQRAREEGTQMCHPLAWMVVG
jgi:hypothetical protein